MSMLSAQVDELRAMAESVGLAMPQAATLMLEAADTIWELRGSVHRERAEADRLREDMEDLEGYDQMLRDRLRQETELQVKAEAENAKLRELLREAIYARDDADWASIVSTAIALGVEVDDG